MSSGINIGEEKAVFVDLGGGSTEICIGNQFECFYANSLPLGAIRLTTRFIGEGWTGPLNIEKYKEIRNYAANRIGIVKAKVQEFGVRLAWGSSGTVINLAEIANKLFKKNGNGHRFFGFVKKEPQKVSADSLFCFA